MEKQTANKATKKSAAAHDPRTEALERIVRAEDSDPFQILGPHWIERAGKHTLAIRLFRPGASEARIIWKNGAVSAAGKIAEGLFEAVTDPVAAKLPADAPVPVDAYRLRFRFPDGKTLETLDAYAFPPLLSDYDLYLFGEGTHYQKYEKLGAHVREVDGIRGVHFAVWAPNAQRVSLVGDFNLWDGRTNAMRNRGSSGIWEIFMPELDEGALYKFEILSRVEHHLGLKSDPYGFAAELRPKTASIVSNIDRYQVERRELARSSRQGRLAACPHVDLRSPPGLLAPQGPKTKPLAHLPDMADELDSLREAHGLHAYRVPAASWSTPSTPHGAIKPSAISR